MSIISQNIKFLRKKKGLTQQAFADEIGIKRSLVGAYEEDRADPKYDLLKKLAIYFDVSIDDFINETIDENWKPAPKTEGASLRVLSITVDNNERENIELVPVKASAGYLNGYADPQYVAELPKFHLPMFKQGTYRAFEINGDSMLPLQSGSIIIGEYLERWTDLKQGDTYVVISKNEGIVYKRIGNRFKTDRKIKLVSDNPVYDPYEIEADDVLEIWKAKGFFSTHLPEPTPEPTMESLTSMVAHMQRSISDLTKNNNN